jgi:hypothetical protein
MDMTLKLDEFVAEALEDEARRQGLPPEEIAVHAISYYLDDCDSGRIAHRVPDFSRVATYRKG